MQALSFVDLVAQWFAAGMWRRILWVPVFVGLSWPYLQSKWRISGIVIGIAGGMAALVIPQNAAFYIGSSLACVTLPSLVMTIGTRYATTLSTLLKRLIPDQSLDLAEYFEDSAYTWIDGVFVSLFLISLVGHEAVPSSVFWRDWPFTVLGAVFSIWTMCAARWFYIGKMPSRGQRKHVRAFLLTTFICIAVCKVLSDDPSAGTFLLDFAIIAPGLAWAFAIYSRRVVYLDRRTASEHDGFRRLRSKALAQGKFGVHSGRGQKQSIKVLRGRFPEESTTLFREIATNTGFPNDVRAEAAVALDEFDVLAQICIQVSGENAETALNHLIDRLPASRSAVKKVGDRGHDYSVRCRASMVLDEYDMLAQICIQVSGEHAQTALKYLIDRLPVSRSAVHKVGAGGHDDSIRCQAAVALDDDDLLSQICRKPKTTPEIKTALELLTARLPDSRAAMDSLIAEDCAPSTVVAAVHAIHGALAHISDVSMSELVMRLTQMSPDDRKTEMIAVADTGGRAAAEIIYSYCFWRLAQTQPKFVPFPLLASNGKHVMNKLVRRLDDADEACCKLSVKTLVAMSRKGSATSKQLKRRLTTERTSFSSAGRRRVDEVLTRWGDDTIPADISETYQKKWRTRRPAWSW